MITSQKTMPLNSPENTEPQSSPENNQINYSTKISQPIQDSPICQPITELSFHIGTDFSICKNFLKIRGYSPLESDIRKGGGKQFVALGYKKEADDDDDNDYITNIIGVASKKQKPPEIIEDGVKYYMVTDVLGNGDINKGSKGVYLYLYWTKEKLKDHKPIKDLIFESHKKKEHFNSNLEMIKNSSSNSDSKGNFDINTGRGGAFNYIIVVR